MIGSGLVRKLFCRRPPPVTAEAVCLCGHSRGEHIYINEYFHAVCIHARKGGTCICSKFEAA